MKAGPYDLTDKIGQGGMGAVWKGQSPQGKTVAVKLIPRWSSGESKARFDRERRLLAMLGSGEGFVPLLDAGDGASGPYLVMPLLGGGTLRDRLEKGPMGVDESIDLGRKLSSALGRAHAAGIVHRDLKPENILYTDDGRPLVADLGLGKHFRTDTPGASQSIALSQAGSTKGTRGYMAPEQMGTAEAAGPPADVFALGTILYECLAGEGPFDAPTAIASVARIHERSWTPLVKLRRETPYWLWRAVERAIDPDPAVRFSDGASLAQALEAGASGEGEVEPARAKGPFVAAAVGMTLILGGALFVAQRAKTTSADASSAAAATPSPGRPAVAPSPAGPPDWFRALPEAERPPLPLPAGVAFGKKSGEYVNEKDGSVLVFVPAGTFTMGSNEDGLGLAPVHEVELSAYFLGKLEVAVRQFAAFVKETHYTTEAERSGTGLVADEGLFDVAPRAGACWKTPLGADGAPAPLDHPVVQVTWSDARAYAEWAGVSLPTEAEWERAAGWDAKAGKARRYSWGDQDPKKGTPRVANLPDESIRKWRPFEMSIFGGYDDGFVRLAPVGSFPQGASPVGALDMTGNASEICLDSWAADLNAWLAQAPKKDPCCTEESGKIVERGGNWGDAPSIFRNSHRNDLGRAYAVERVGFRIARPLAPRAR